MSALEHHLNLAAQHLGDAAALVSPYGPAREALSFAMRHLGKAEGYLGLCGGPVLTDTPPAPTSASDPSPWNTTNPPGETEEPFPESPAFLDREDADLIFLTPDLALYRETGRLYRPSGRQMRLHPDLMVARSENPHTGEPHYQLLRRGPARPPLGAGSRRVSSTMNPAGK